MTRAVVSQRQLNRTLLARQGAAWSACDFTVTGIGQDPAVRRRAPG